MTPRHGLRVGLAALLAVGPALVLTASPAQAATQAAKPGYVAVVISGHGTHCVKWKSGITGDTVLNDAATVGYRNSDHLIVQIDGAPSSGTADASHYWSYWHDVPATKRNPAVWAYSTDGASGFTPVRGSVEGWSYDNGKSSAPSPSQKPAGLYAKICGAKDKSGGTVLVPAPSTSARSVTTAAASTSTRSRSTQRRDPTLTRTAQSTPSGSTPSTSVRTSTSSTTPSSTASSGRSSTASHAGASPASSAATSPAASSTGPSSSSTTSRSAPRTIDASATASTSSSSGSPVGLFVGLGLVVVLGGGAGAVALRRRHAGG